MSFQEGEKCVYLEINYGETENLVVCAAFLSFPEGGGGSVGSRHRDLD